MNPRLPHHRTCGSASGGSDQTNREALRLTRLVKRALSGTPEPSHASHRGEMKRPWPTGFDGLLPLHAVGEPPTGSALRDIESSGIIVLAGIFFAPGSLLTTMASAYLPTAFPPWDLPEAFGIRSVRLSPLRSGSPGKNALLPKHNRRIYLRGLNQDFALWCQLVHPAGLLCDFCSSACRFRLAFLPASGCPRAVGFN